MFQEATIVPEGTCVTAEAAREHAFEFVEERTNWHGFIEVVGSERNWMFLVRRDGVIVTYEG